MARRREQPAPTPTAGAVPAELAAGPCVEVWGAHDRDLLGARQAWRAARTQWLAEHGYREREYGSWPRELRDRAPYSRTDPYLGRRRS